MRKAIITASLFLFCALYAAAQSTFSITYSVGFPTGETSDYFESTSWRGVNIDYQYFLQENFTLGFSTGWQVYDDERGYVTETFGTETLSGFRYNYLNSVPILITGAYYFNPSNNISPYVNVGLGLVYNELSQDTGLLGNDTTGWPFSVRPEVGLDFKVGYRVGIRTSLRYNYVASGDELPSLPYFAFNLGVVWGY